MPIKRLVLAEINDHMHPMLLEYDTNTFEAIDSIYEYSPLNLERETNRFIFFNEFFVKDGYKNNPPQRVLFADMNSCVLIDYTDPQDGSHTSSYLEVGELIPYNSTFDTAKHPYPKPDLDNPDAVVHVGFNPLQEGTEDYGFIMNKYNLVKIFLNPPNVSLSPTQQIDDLIYRAQEQDARLKGKPYEPEIASISQPAQNLIPAEYVAQIQNENQELLMRLMQQENHANQAISHISFVAQQHTHRLEAGIKNSQLQLSNSKLVEIILRQQINQQQEYAAKLERRKKAAEHQLQQERQRANKLAQQKLEQEITAKKALEQKKFAEDTVAKNKQITKNLKKELKQQQKREAEILKQKQIAEQELANKLDIERSLEREKLRNEQLLADKKHAEQLLLEKQQKSQKRPDKNHKKLQANKDKTKNFAIEQEAAWNDDKLFSNTATNIDALLPKPPTPMLTSWNLQQKQEQNPVIPDEPIELECELDHGYFSLNSKLGLCTLLIYYYVFLYNNVDLFNEKNGSERKWEDYPIIFLSVFEAQIITAAFKYMLRYWLDQSLENQVQDVIRELKTKEPSADVRLAKCRNTLFN